MRHRRHLRREEELAEALEALLRSAVRSHLAADVPVGAMLSGGWDSSLVATFAAAEAPRLKTFSIVFPESPAFDEGPHGRRVAAAIGSEHHVVEFRSSALLGRLPRVVRDLEPVLVPQAFAASCVDLQQRRLGYDLHGRLPESILWMTDKTGMAHSLEARSPFLDRDVIDFAARLPSRFKHDGTTAKRILRPLARRWLPPAIAARRKAGLRYPPGLWRRPALRREAAALVPDSGARTPFRRAAVERLLGGRMPRGAWSERVVRSIAVLQLWWTQFIAPE